MKPKANVGFWNQERCEYCDGPIADNTVDLPRKAGKRYVFIKSVPVGVCKECGSLHFVANVPKNVDATVRRRRKAKSLCPCTCSKANSGVTLN